jgi:tRNA A37 threonylcarbamoyladenosine synthetase subunit TsaC/SUA5/YrdC
MQVETIIKLRGSSSLCYKDLQKITETLYANGIVIFASDSAFAVGVLPSSEIALRRLELLLPNKANDPVPLSFGTATLMRCFVEITAKDEILLEEFGHGQLSLVCRIRAGITNLAEAGLHVHGSVGARVSNSPIERQISNFVQSPITTPAVRSDDGDTANSFDEMIDLIRMRLAEIDDTIPICVVSGVDTHFCGLSTVLTVQMIALPAGTQLDGPSSLHIFRPGRIESKRLQQTLEKYSGYFLEDIT